MRAAIYIRVSTEEQKLEGYSVESQTEVCLRWIREKNYDLSDTYVDEGYSAKNLKRPSLQRMIKDFDKRKFDILVFWRLNRLTRSVKDKVFLFELIEANRIGLKSMTEDIDTTTASGRMVTNILISVAQGEREQTSENVHGTMMERALKGIRQGATAPYGYRLEEGKLFIIPEEAEVVRRIYEMYKKPMSDNTIAKIFNRPPAVPRSTGKWSGFAIHYILTNPVYCGKLRWNYRKVEGKRTYNEIIVPAQWDPIISEEEFEEIQKMRKRRAITHERTNSTYAFTGVLKCGRCGYGMIGVAQKREHGGKTRFYRCTNRSNFGLCDMPQIHEDTVTQMFLAATHEDSEPFKQLFRIDKPQQDVDAIKEQYKRDLEAVRRRKKRWHAAYGAEAISIEELKEHMTEEKEKEDYLLSKLEAAPEKEKSPYTREEIMELFKSFSSVWYSITDEQAKKSFIREVFETITIDSEWKHGKGGRYIRTPAHIVDWRLND